MSGEIIFANELLWLSCPWFLLLLNVKLSERQSQWHPSLDACNESMEAYVMF